MDEWSWNKMAVAHDSISQILTALACFILIYLATFEQTFIILFPTVLLVTGIVLQFYLARKVEVVDGLAESAGNIGFYTLIALAGITIASFVSPAISYLPKMELTGVDAMLYAVLIAVAEEQFFRGAILNFLLTLTDSTVAIFSSAVIFMVYHFAVYGTSTLNLVYVLIGGLALSWVAYRSGRLSPSILAHVLNNILSFIVVK
jgi:membrane protease YdiL (CAAX protease family)